MKLKKWIQEKRGYILAFFIPLLLSGAVFLLLKMFLFQKNTIFVSDMKEQYVGLFTYFRDVLMGQNSLLYSFSDSLGGNMWGTFSYYLASPLNILVALFPRDHMNLAMLLIVVMKLSLAGLTMFCLLRHHYPKQKPIYLLIFSTCYALSGYVVGYYFHPMWLDGVYLAPLVLLGIDLLIKGKSPLLYIITLFLSIVTNYYIGYMLCLFSVVYFLYRVILNFRFQTDRKKIISVMIQFGISSLLAGGMAMFIVIPTLYDIALTSKMDSEVFQRALSLNLNPFDYLSNTFVGSHNREVLLNVSGFLLYTGVLTIPLFLFYFMNKKISLREKICSAGVLLIFFASFSINYLNYIWHGFNAPLCFEGRYVFLFGLFVLLLASRSFEKLESISKLKYFVIAPVIPILALPIILSNYIYLDDTMVWVTVAFYLLYLVLLYLLNHPRDQRDIKLLSVLLVGLVSAELGFNFFYCIQDYSFAERNFYQGYAGILYDQIEQVKKQDQTPFYRIEKNFQLGSTDSLLLNSRGATMFLSTLPKKTINFFSNNAFTGLVNSLDYVDGSTPYLDSILGIKYYFSRTSEVSYYNKINDFAFSRYDEKLYGIASSQVHVYENPYALPLGFLVSTDSLHFEDDYVKREDITKLAFQDQMLKSMLGTDDDLMIPASIEKVDDLNYILTITDTKNIYLMLHTEMGMEEDRINVYINDQLVQIYNNRTYNRIYIENHYQVGDQLKIRLEILQDARALGSPNAYYFDFDVFEKAMKQLSEHPYEVETFNNTYISGTIDVPEEGPTILYTSIPNNPGWTVKVDGKKVEPVELYSVMMGVPLTEGQHRITFSYFPPGLSLGIVISGGALLMTIVFLLVRKKVLLRLAD